MYSGTNDTSLIAGSNYSMYLFFCVELHDLVTLGVGICELWCYWEFWIQNGGISNLVVRGFGKNGRIGNSGGICKFITI